MSLFSPQATPKELMALSRSLGTSLHSGIDVVKSLEMAARRSSGSMKTVLQDVTSQIKSGSDITTAIEAHGNYFPELFIDIVQVGERTGSLPEVLRSLSHHYENNLRLKKDFIGQITLPLIQLFIAIFVIAGLILVLGWISEMNDGMEIDILGWGMLGPTGALQWLGGWAMAIISLLVGYKLISQSLSGKKVVHRLLMQIPVVGTCMQDFAIARFSWAFHLTQQAGMPIEESLESSLRATSNGAFIAATDDIIRQIQEGDSLTDAFDSSQLFPMEFIQTVHVAEESGTVPEALDRLSPQFEDNARRSLRALAVTAGWLIWASVACFIIFIVFKIILWYVQLLNGFIDEANRV